MKTLAARLKYALYKRDLSQTDAAKLCSISQQSINYILKNDLKSSKLATQIATGLQINPEWLMFGTGRFESQKIYDVPVLATTDELSLFLKNAQGLEPEVFTITDRNLGNRPFAYLVEPNKLAVCASQEMKFENLIFKEYLTIDGANILINNEMPKDDTPGFLICEWRIHNVNFH